MKMFLNLAVKLKGKKILCITGQCFGKSNYCGDRGFFYITLWSYSGNKEAIHIFCEMFKKYRLKNIAFSCMIEMFEDLAMETIMDLNVYGRKLCRKY